MNTRKDYIEKRLIELSLKTERDYYDTLEETRLEKELKDLLEKEKLNNGCGR